MTLRNLSMSNFADLAQGDNAGVVHQRGEPAVGLDGEIDRAPTGRPVTSRWM